MNATENRLTVSQKGRDCGEIRFTFGVGKANRITPAMAGRAERELLANPQHQLSYYDLLLVTPEGKELDFETSILSEPAPVCAG